MRHLYCHHSSSSRRTGLGAKTGWLMSTTPSVLIAIRPPLDVFLESDDLLVSMVPLDADLFAAFYVVSGGDVCAEFVVGGTSVLKHKLYRLEEVCHSIFLTFSLTPGSRPSDASISCVQCFSARHLVMRASFLRTPDFSKASPAHLCSLSRSRDVAAWSCVGFWGRFSQNTADTSTGSLIGSHSPK